MNNIKYGKFSMVLKFDKISDNNLLKVTYLNNKYHDDSKYNNIIKTIDKYDKYYSLVDSIKYQIDINSELYQFLKNIKINNEEHEIIKSNFPLCYYIIPNDGETDLLDNMRNLQSFPINNIWIGNTLLKLKLFIKQISLAIYFLHNNQICHFDIKPENILVNLGKYNHIKTFHLKFKLIDFGFAEKKPFPKYLKNGNGTPGYTTKFYGYNYYDNYIPYLKPNDWENGTHKSICNNKGISNNKEILPYKTDIFSLGITFNFLFLILDEVMLLDEGCICLLNKYKDLPKILELIQKMTEPNILNRLNIAECIYKIKSFNLKK